MTDRSILDPHDYSQTTALAFGCINDMVRVSLKIYTYPKKMETDRFPYKSEF